MKFFIPAITIILLFANSKAFSQNLCAQNLKKAQTSYDEGRINEVPLLLQSCLESGFTKEEKILAYKLLTLTYIYLDEAENADESLLYLLRTHHEYAVNETVDPNEFINLYRTFRTWPVYFWSIKFGPNVGLINSSQEVTVDPYDSPPGKYKSLARYQGAVAIEVPIKKGFSAAAEGYVIVRGHRYTKTINGVSDLTMEESQTLLSAPILAKYTLNQKNKLRPYVSAGGAVSYLLSAKANVSRISTEGRPESGPAINLIEYKLRNILLYNAVAGAGFNYKLGTGYLNFELKYFHGFNNVAKKNNRYLNDELVFDYWYLDHDFSISNFMVTIGATMPKYIPKKLKMKKS